MLPSDPVKVGYVTKMYPRFSETFIVNEVLALEAAGLDLEIFSLRSPVDGHFHETLGQVRAPVTYLGTHLRAQGVWERLRQAHQELPRLQAHLPDLLELGVDDAASALELALLVRRRRITRLHAHFASVGTAVARVAARIAGIGYSFTAHAKDIFHIDVDPKALRRRLADAEFTVTVSDFNLEHLQRSFGPAAGRVVRVYNGLDLDRFPYRDPTDRTPVVVAVGRLVEKKGFAQLLDAVALLVRAGRALRLDLVGTGDQEEALQARIDALGLGEHVRMLGAQPQHQVKEIVAAAAVLAAPCVVGADGNRDGLPTVLLEAMALGTPCVATPVTGIPEAIRHEDTGLLVAQADPGDLATALGRLLDDGTLRARLAGNARALIEAEFDSAHTSSTLHRLFTAHPPAALPTVTPALGASLCSPVGVS